MQVPTCQSRRRSRSASAVVSATRDSRSWTRGVVERSSECSKLTFVPEIVRTLAVGLARAPRLGVATCVGASDWPCSRRPMIYPSPFNLTYFTTSHFTLHQSTTAAASTFRHSLKKDACPSNSIECSHSVEAKRRVMHATHSGYGTLAFR